jgi:hypothetical protein
MRVDLDHDLGADHRSDGWSGADAALSCPHCIDDLTQIVVAHALPC